MKSEYKITDIFFDLDHTLLDRILRQTLRLLSKVFFKAYRFPFSLADFMEIYSPINHRYWKYYRNNEITTEQLRFLRLHQTFNALKKLPKKTTIDELSTAYIEGLSSFTHLFDGTINLLNYLKTNYRLHIIN